MIGSSTTPYTKKAKITLFGDWESDVLTMSGNFDHQNTKAVSNTGRIKLFGKSRSNMARLTAEA